jgi:bacillithiol system protein YtxJ
MAKSRVEMSWNFEADEIEAYYLDLIAYREVSNYIASEFGVDHQSPQALLIKDGKCTYNASHLNIRVADLGVRN